MNHSSSLPRPPFAKPISTAGFTLIELAIVLVVIGLIVGGVLVGRDLISSAEVRAQISQIEKYNTAVNTFRGKYNALPGDMDARTAKQFGFTPRGTLPGEGDGNGLIEAQNGIGGVSDVSTAGEPSEFWVDLTTANGLNLNLIEGSFNTATPTNYPGMGGTGAVIGTGIDKWLPPAKLGKGNYIYVWNYNSANYYGISTILQLNGGDMYSNAGMTPQQAYNIDTKMDDGLPQSGKVIALYVPLSFSDWAMYSYSTEGFGGAVPGAAAPLTSMKCYDNGNHAVVVAQYSLSNTTLNCALSFQFQ